MEESKSGPYDLQQAVSLFMERKVGIPTVRAALQRCPESAKDVSCTVSRRQGEWVRLKRLHDSTIGAALFASMTVSGKVLVVWVAQFGSELGGVVGCHVCTHPCQMMGP